MLVGADVANAPGNVGERKYPIPPAGASAEAVSAFNKSHHEPHEPHEPRVRGAPKLTILGIAKPLRSWEQRTM